jgi:hypothetical protein
MPLHFCATCKSDVGHCHACMGPTRHFLIKLNARSQALDGFFLVTHDGNHTELAQRLSSRAGLGHGVRGMAFGHAGQEGGRARASLTRRGLDHAHRSRWRVPTGGSSRVRRGLRSRGRHAVGAWASKALREESDWTHSGVLRSGDDLTARLGRHGARAQLRRGSDEG